MKTLKLFACTLTMTIAGNLFEPASGFSQMDDWSEVAEDVASDSSDLFEWWEPLEEVAVDYYSYSEPEPSIEIAVAVDVDLSVHRLDNVPCTCDIQCVNGDLYSLGYEATCTYQPPLPDRNLSYEVHDNLEVRAIDSFCVEQGGLHADASLCDFIPPLRGNIIREGAEI